MKFEYDSEVDILMIKLRKAKKYAYADQSDNVITHYNKKGEAVELEILDAKKTFKQIFEKILNSKSNMKA